MARGKVTSMKNVQVVKKLSGKKYTLPVKLPERFKKPNKLPQTQKEITRKVKVPDPFITILQNIMDDSGMDAIQIAVETARMGRAISWKTVNNLIIGRTFRPQHYTCESIIIACGQEILIQKRPHLLPPALDKAD